jgi:hypothetical protein
MEALEKNGEYEIADKSNFCPRCGTETKETDECSPLGNKRLCKKCDLIFIKEIFIDCINKKAKIKLKSI